MQTTSKPPATRDTRPWWRGRPRPGERGAEALLVLAAAVSIATTGSIVVALTGPTVEFFQRVGVTEFLTGTEWSPLFRDPEYGILPLLVATLTVTGVAIGIAVPLGIGSAMYLSEYTRAGTRKALKPILEVLAGVPTVVYGAFALFALGPLVREVWPGREQPAFQNMLIAGIAMGVMILPTVASLAEDAMSAVPRSLREGAYALASSRMQVSIRVVVPAAMSGIVAAVVLGLSRAIGETMIVTVAAGSTSNHVEWNPIQGAATMTAYIAGAGAGDLPVDSFDYRTIFAVGAVLFGFTFLLNALSIRMVRRFREVYE
ncbi:MAG TPA: phosphate ABC transporter permease subunit PstC [Micromonosporaceae bacterium]